MLSVYHTVCGDKCDYQCLSGLCRYTEQSHPFTEFHLVIISDGITVSAEPNRPYGLQWYRTEDGYELPGIGRGGLVKVNRAKNTVYISTTVVYE